MMVILHKLFDKRKLILYPLLTALGVFVSLYYSKECYRGISNGIDFCIGVLVPSLFFFMTVSAFAVRSDTALLLSKPFSKVMKHLFGLPDISFVPMAAALLGGYPVGARCIASLFERRLLSEKQAEKTAYIAVSAGPGFLLNYTALALMNSKEAGYILLVSQFLSMIITGILVKKVIPCDTGSPSVKALKSNDNLLVGAVADASKGVFSMCAMVLLFSALTEVISCVLASCETASDILSGILEVTTGLNRTALRYPLYVTAFFVGFGGLSVHFQIFASLKQIPVNKILFFLFRITEGIITAAAAYILVSIFPVTKAAFSTTQEKTVIASSAPLWGSLALILSALFFLGTISQGGNYVRNSRHYFKRS